MRNERVDGRFDQRCLHPGEAAARGEGFRGTP
jgi:hypothetical protein